MNDHMFKVKEGKVHKVAPIFGQKGIDRTYKDGEQHKPDRTHYEVAVSSSPAVINAKGYK